MRTEKRCAILAGNTGRGDGNTRAAHCLVPNFLCEYQELLYRRYLRAIAVAYRLQSHLAFPCDASSDNSRSCCGLSGEAQQRRS
jgi:hypothetical protein